MLACLFCLDCDIASSAIMGKKLLIYEPLLDVNGLGQSHSSILALF